MNLKVGIVGLPNVGKSTLFNALLKKQVAFAANYPFATIEPNVGVVEVPDSRLSKLAQVVKTTKIVPAVVEFYDIAGLVKGASTGEGLGNKFLSHIREVSVLVHVVRLFEDESIVHVSDIPNPTDDIQTVETELILADLSTLQKQKEPKGNAATKEEKHTYAVCQKVKEDLNKGVSIRNQILSENEYESIKYLNLLTAKPVIFLFNISENQLKNMGETNKQISVILGSHATPGSDSGSIRQTQDKQARMTNYTAMPVKLENEIIEFSPEDQAAYLREYGLEETGLNRLIQKAYETLNLISFLTGGEIEARAWTITRGTKAPQAAAAIHTDFEKKFIKAEIAKYDDFIEVGGWTGAREKGKVTLAGADYEMQDGDVVDFKIGV